MARPFKAFGRAAVFETFMPREPFSRGDEVVAPGYERRRSKATGQAIGTEWATVFSLSGGKIARFHNFLDTHAVAAAHLGA